MTMGVVFCAQCGARNDGDARFCGECGRPLETAPAGAPVAADDVAQPVDGSASSPAAVVPSADAGAPPVAAGAVTPSAGPGAGGVGVVASRRRPRWRWRWWRPVGRRSSRTAPSCGAAKRCPTRRRWRRRPGPRTARNRGRSPVRRWCRRRP
ncbi:zinc ribbon domain-containing protein [Bifidobacterium pullorum subsp. saeculare]|uniref:Zinc ribbon domain-containing protein n=1 Tax=Bifidobacterium pullorum subsp. saeculare TaxID=78257 RepID=A0A938WWE4_9BIFI|nr:zinc ribbon domain-containing protein [Bifidobacterium pullorum subsp. saeculare]